MKRIFCIAFLLLLGSAGAGFAGDPAWLELDPNSSYTISQATISISSDTVTTIAAETRYREIYIGDPSTTVSIFYRVDGSTVSIPTVGWWIPAGQWGRIESNSAINLQLGAGESSVTARRMTVQK
ncbi:MAG: hypothetical protein HY548_03490 [Elusimicrobia bacterium]|nr:hypothetical protein [Elusimicrobiota bacterium]